MPRLSCLLLAAMSSTCFAAEIPTDAANVSSVTVYSDRAEIIRHLSTQVEAGDHSLTFENLPGATDLSSVRVDGKGAFTLIDIRAERIQTKEVADERVRSLNEKIDALRAQIAELNSADNRITQRKAALEKVLTRLTSVGKESANAEMDPSKWSTYLQYHVDTLAKLDKEILANGVTRTSANDELNRLGRELQSLNTQRFKYRNVARVRIEAKQAGPIEFNLAYIVRGPSWAPLYDIRADTKAKSVQVNYYAEVRQSTGEDWKGVALRLSTAQPNLGGREPQMSPWTIHRQLPMVASRSFGEGGGRGTGGSAMKVRQAPMDVALAAASKPMAPADDLAMERSVASVSSGATAATFTISRPYDIPSDNKPAKVAIAAEGFPCEFRHTCVPKASPYVFLKSKAVNKSAFPFLSGPSAVFLDGAFVANANLDLVTPGQEFWTYLGVDQSVKVDLKDLGKVEEQSGIFGKKTARTVVSKVFKVTNGKLADIELTIRDQIPSSNHEQIKVVIQEPAYEKDTAAFKVDEQKFVEWNLQLKPSAKLDVPFRFAIERPEGFPIVGQ